MAPKGGDRSTAYAVVGMTATRPSGGNLHSPNTNGTMSSQDSIKTAASDLPPNASSFSAASGPGTGPTSPTILSGSAGSSGGMPPEDWGLTIGSSFPSVEQPKYTIKAEIDDGGMGVVYEAHQGDLGVVAIKVIKPRILGQAASERFLNEARAMAKVRTEPGIATIFDCDWYTDAATGTRAPFIVMEYVPGALPITMYANEHRLGLRARLELFQKVCEAVAAAHKADIIHRDLKPSNVMVNSAGHPKVIDFGLAVVRDPTEHSKRLPSERGGLFGTLEYMSPEQAAKRFDPHVLTAASDVYSLGVILYELLLGQLPYAEHPGTAVKKSETGVADYSEATRIIREDPPVPPHRLNRGIHPGVEGILLKALEKEPGKRFGTAREFAEAIQRHIRGSLRRDVVRSIPVVAAAFVVAYLVGLPAFFEWTRVNDWYQRAAAWAAPALDQFRHVVLVTADEGTKLDAFELPTETAQRKLGFGGNQRQRPLWAGIGRKLSESGCRVAAFDLIFDLPSPDAPSDDDDLVGAIERLQASGTHCVLGAAEWTDVPQSMSKVMTAPGVDLGAVWLRADRGPWLVEAALMRDNAVHPSFSLSAAAAWRHKKQSISFDFGEASEVVRIKYAASADAALRNDPDPIPVNRIVRGDATEVAAPAADSLDVYSPSDQVAIMYLPKFPTDKAFEAATIDAGRLMTMETAELRKHCNEKVVVLANRHVDFADSEFMPTSDGRRIPKSFGHALAIEMMLAKTPIIGSPVARSEYLGTIVAAIAGVCIAFVFPGRLGIAVMIGVGAVGVLVGMSLLGVRYAGSLFNPIVPSAALLMATSISAVLPEILRRFRV